MPDDFDPLRAALNVSPANVPLRKHLAQGLIKSRRHEEAEQLLREGLSRTPGSADLKLELARLYFVTGKTSQAIVIVEDMVRDRNVPAEARMFYARLLLHTGDAQAAVEQFHRAQEEDPEVVDLELADQLGITDDFDDDFDDEAEIIDGRIRERAEQLSESQVEVERPEASFEDVGGMEPLKEEIRLKIIYPLQRPEIYQAYGKRIGGGVLMYGPPGCGKTHLARATAGEIDAAFIAVGISDVLDMWLGGSERNMRRVFDQARERKPCVLFFDEVDALGAKRSDMSGGSGRHVINQFLSEMDGVDSLNDGLLILAATNAPWQVDAAFRRPGRFDRIIFVPPPDEPARAEILGVLCRGKPQENINFAQVAAKTKDFSGADLKAVVEMAIEQKLAEALKSGMPTPLTTKDLLASAKRLKPTTREWFATARNHAIYSNEGGLYDDVLAYLNIKR